MNRADVVLLGRRGLDAFFSNRKIILVCLVALSLVYYIWSAWLSKGRYDGHISDRAAFCRESALRPYIGAANGFDVAIFDCFTAPCLHKQFIPFIGNGHFGLSPLHQSQGPELRIQYGPSLRIQLLRFDPIIHMVVEGGIPSADAYVTDYTRGTVTHLKNYAFTGECVTIVNQLYFHRKHPNTLIQDVVVKNPTGHSLGLTFQRSDPDWQDVTTVRVPEGSSGVQYRLMTTSVPLPNKKDKIHVFTAALPTLEPSLHVEARKNHHLRFITGIDTSEPTSTDLYANNRNIVEKQLTKAVARVNALSLQQVYDGHISVWQRLSKTGMSLSYSKAPNTLNADLVNATKYYVLTNTPAPLHEVDIADSSIGQVQKALLAPGQCYSAHNTLLYPSKLWSDFNSVDDVVNAATRWKLTLEKFMCGGLFEAGADGLVQAMVLSLGGFKFTHRHLEFATHPKDLHRDYTFSGIRMNNSTLLNIVVQVDTENKAVMYASVTGGAGAAVGGQTPLLTPTPAVNAADNVSPVYVCDAGCMDNPVMLRSEWSELIPVKLTDPVTPILYITSDKSHMEELKHTIHVKEVNLAPAHEHHVIAMHKHGHRLGGLPTFFWISLFLLVTIFHLFLFRLIYNEYCSADAKPYYNQRGRYAV